MLAYLVNDALGAEAVEVPGGDEVEAAVAVVLQVRAANEGGAETGVDGGVADEALSG